MGRTSAFNAATFVARQQVLDPDLLRLAYRSYVACDGQRSLTIAAMIDSFQQRQARGSARTKTALPK
jgi:hypothetical protein